MMSLNSSTHANANCLDSYYTMLLLSSHSTIFLGENETVLQHGHPAYTDQEPADQGEREEVGGNGDAERRIGSG
jgi:hypothetical protein